ncbi:putative membrane protein YphA (DoxX/SURF4 family) [Aurantimonas endophytica]|uniref:Putative membrane protein YphA (DoxX/SURF4 family) n=2 Tax=Aurantimonas endophytica TaxID=1522175 RepID=A0A7W6HHZ7_9HYPH|nr:putative membrane protein YphA (DoxX/SURF4 family) [Aurantimonas endophytica]
MMVEIFAQIGLGQGFRYLTGIVEFIGGLWLFVPGMTALAALWLAATMVGAILAHLLVLPESGMPAAVLLALSLVLVWLHRDQLVAMKARVG